LESPRPGREINLIEAHPDFEVPSGIVGDIEAVVSAEQFEIVDLNVVFTDHSTVTGLNKSHLDRDYQTDVLAFDLRDPERRALPEVEGEIYIDMDTAFERAPEFGVSFDDEVRRYTIHGLLHLIGYRDDDPIARKEIKRLENLYLGSLINPETAG
jgi:rRNA maturation RNase YbeY